MPNKPAETRESVKREAEHARRLAKQFPGDDAADRLRAYADELETRASRMRDCPIGTDRSRRTI